jgi:membrane fusion protein, heavy metal efflux system
MTRVNCPTAILQCRAMLISMSLAIAVSGCAQSDGDNSKESPKAALVPDSAERASATARVTFSAAQVQHGGVQWSAATATTAASTIELPGQLVPNEDRTSYVGAPAEGRVITVHVRPGDRVTQGQVLVTLKGAEASVAAADFDKAKGGVTAATATLSHATEVRMRADRLFALKAASREEVEHAALDETIAQSGLEQARAELTRASSARAQLGATGATGAMVLRSPLRGVVLSRSVTPGTVAQAGAPLVAVTDPSSLWLEIAASDRAITGIRTGARVRFNVPAFPGDTFGALVESVGGALDTITRTIPVRAVVKNTDGRLRPAMFATALIDGGAMRAVVVLPSDAVQMLDNRSVVFVARPDGKGGATFERRDVETESSTGARTEVVRGLAAGDLVVTTGAFAIKSEFARAKMAGE